MSQMKLFFTIDTEVYPINQGWEIRGLADDVSRDIYGDTSEGAFGVAYQLRVFERYGLRAVFFVEGLHASCPSVGLGPLTDLVQLIRSHDQEIQLHVHPEWLPYARGVSVEDRGYVLTSYNEHEQRELIETAADNLVRAGAPTPSAFRAGDFAANRDTLRALSKLGFRFDTSYNYPYLGSTCKIDLERALWQPAQFDGIWEFPVSCYSDYPKHYRHCELGACSVGEFRASLNSAVENCWDSYVLVSHSFEMIANRRSARRVRPKRRVVKRFEELCRLLSSISTTVQTSHFNDLEPTTPKLDLPIKGNLVHYVWRNIQQAMEIIEARFAS
jgi:Polysaccharide deacetylase